jgi:hypothetical protein
MSKAAKSVFVFGIYLIFIGLGFLLVPNTVLGLFGLPMTIEPWIHVAAMLLLILAYFYIKSALSESTSFFHLTVHHRASVIVFFIVFVVVGIAPPVLILFGVFDFAAAIWTAWTLKSK